MEHRRWIFDVAEVWRKTPALSAEGGVRGDGGVWDRGGSRPIEARRINAFITGPHRPRWVAPPTHIHCAN